MGRPNVFMQPPELRAILKILDKKHRMLEYGAGGSTMLFAPLVRHYVSIEHDERWYRWVSNRAGRLTNLELHFVPADCNVAPIYSGSYVNGYENAWKTYSRACLSLGLFDRVLIDGRSRLACAMNALRVLRPGGLIAIHDFWLRPRYHPILQYADIVREIRTGQTLVILKPKD